MRDIREVAEELYSSLDDIEYTLEETLNALEKPCSIFFSMDDFLSMFFFDFVPADKIKCVKEELIRAFDGSKNATFKHIRTATFYAIDK